MFVGSSDESDSGKRRRPKRPAFPNRESSDDSSSSEATLKRRPQKIKKKAAPMKEEALETNMVCPCGRHLFLVDGSMGQIFCDVCGRDMRQGESHYHCTSGPIKDHPKGFDCCTECAVCGRLGQMKTLFDPKKRRKVNSQPRAIHLRKSSTKSAKTAKQAFRQAKAEGKQMISKVKRKYRAPQTFVERGHSNLLKSSAGTGAAIDAKQSNVERLAHKNIDREKALKKLKDEVEGLKTSKKDSFEGVKAIKAQVHQLVIKNEQLTRQIKLTKHTTEGYRKQMSKIARQAKPSYELDKILDRVEETSAKSKKKLKATQRNVQQMFTLFMGKFDNLTKQLDALSTRVEDLEQSNQGAAEEGGAVPNQTE